MTNSPTMKEAAARIAAEMAREEESARAEAKRQLPSARAERAQWAALSDQCSADLQNAMRAGETAFAHFQAIKRDALKMPAEEAALAYARAKEDLRKVGDRTEVMRERFDHAVCGRDGCDVRVIALEAQARGYNLHTMKVAGTWLANSDVDRLVRRAGLDGQAVAVLRKIAAGEEVANGAHELARVTASITEAEGR